MDHLPGDLDVDRLTGVVLLHPTADRRPDAEAELPVDRLQRVAVLVDVVLDVGLVLGGPLLVGRALLDSFERDVRGELAVAAAALGHLDNLFDQFPAHQEALAGVLIKRAVLDGEVGDEVDDDLVGLQALLFGGELERVIEGDEQGKSVLRGRVGVGWDQHSNLCLPMIRS